jgi:hypothetical protein
MMALKAPAGNISVLSDYGLSVDLPEAYHKIWNVQSPAPGSAIKVDLNVYANEEARQETKNPVGMRTLFLAPPIFENDDTLYSAIYKAIKSQIPEYIDAIDC